MPQSMFLDGVIHAYLESLSSRFIDGSSAMPLVVAAVVVGVGVATGGELTGFNRWSEWGLVVGYRSRRIRSVTVRQEVPHQRNGFTT